MELEWFFSSFSGFPRVFLGFTGFYCVVPSVTGFLWILHRCTRFFLGIRSCSLGSVLFSSIPLSLSLPLSFIIHFVFPFFSHPLTTGVGAALFLFFFLSLFFCIQKEHKINKIFWRATAAKKKKERKYRHGMKKKYQPDEWPPWRPMVDVRKKNQSQFIAAKRRRKRKKYKKKGTH